MAQLIPAVFVISNISGMVRIFLLLFMIADLNTVSAAPLQDLSAYKHNKQIPAIIEQEVLVALSHYPELSNTRIRFVFKKNIKGSVMQAQPVFGSLFKSREARAYQINISALFKLNHSALPIHQLPGNILVGWIGHELGHIMDYERKSNPGLISFGLSYIFSATYRRSSELVADTYAVESGLGQYIIDTKRFILDHAELPAAYKAKIARIYLSPDQIVEQVRILEEKKINDQKKALGH